MTILADQLSKGVLKEMKHRILTSNIQKEKLQFDEDTERMRDFFNREIKRYNHRKEQIQAKQQDLQHHEQHILAYRSIIRKLLAHNNSLSNKCQKNNMPITKVKV